MVLGPSSLTNSNEPFLLPSDEKCLKFQDSARSFIWRIYESVNLKSEKDTYLRKNRLFLTAFGKIQRLDRTGLIAIRFKFLEKSIAIIDYLARLVRFDYQIQICHSDSIGQSDFLLLLPTIAYASN